MAIRRRLHNFIVDYREANNVDNNADKSIFDEDCRRFLATQSNVRFVGVHGGEDDIRLDDNGNPYLGGHPTNIEAETTTCEGKAIRENIKEYIAKEECSRPPSNWYRENNRVFDS